MTPPVAASVPSADDPVTEDRYPLLTARDIDNLTQTVRTLNHNVAQLVISQQKTNELQRTTNVLMRDLVTALGGPRRPTEEMEPLALPAVVLERKP